MADLSCRYLGIELQNPFLVGGKGISDAVDKNIELESRGAGAILLPSISEEIITSKSGNHFAASPNESNFISYCKLIEETKKSVQIPVIASVNCYSADDWYDQLTNIENAGADALELIIQQYPFDKDFRADDYERIYLDMALKASCAVKIPISVRIHPYFTNIVNIADQLFYRGVTGIVLFNHPFCPEIDLDEFEIKPNNGFEHIAYNPYLLRFTAIISSQINKVDIAAYNIGHCKSIIKLILAGANVIVLSSVIREQGLEIISSLKSGISDWLLEKGFDKIEHIHKQTNYLQLSNPGDFERQHSLYLDL